MNIILPDEILMNIGSYCIDIDVRKLLGFNGSLKILPEKLKELETELFSRQNFPYNVDFFDDAVRIRTPDGVYVIRSHLVIFQKYKKDTCVITNGEVYKLNPNTNTWENPYPNTSICG